MKRKRNSNQILFSDPKSDDYRTRETQEADLPHTEEYNSPQRISFFYYSTQTLKSTSYPRTKINKYHLYVFPCRFFKYIRTKHYFCEIRGYSEGYLLKSEGCVYYIWWGNWVWEEMIGD